MKIIVLDRDGVINQDSDAYIKHPNEWHPEAGSIQAIVKLKQAGWTVAIATNQSGICRGLYDHAILSAMHQKLQELLIAEGGITAGVNWISFSPYLEHHGSVCRKPAQGMLQAIENRFNVSLEGCPMVGDTLKDIEAAQSKGMIPYFVKTGKGQSILDRLDSNGSCFLKKVNIHSNLLCAVETILQ